MAFKFIHARSLSQTLPERDAPDERAYFGLHGNWSDQMVTAVATSAAVSVVAIVAILMGMV